MKRLPNELWYEILGNITDFNNIRPISNFFNNYFIEKAKHISILNINYDYRYNMYVYKLDNECEILADKLNFMKYFPNIKTLTISNDYLKQNINKIISKCFPAGIEILSLSIGRTAIEDETGRHGYCPSINWKKLKRFKNLTHLYVDCSMFYNFHDSDPEDDFHAPSYTYIDGSPLQSVHKILNTLQETKLYYLYVSNYDHDWSGVSSVWVIKDKTPDFDKVYKQLQEDSSNRKYTYDII